MPKWIIVIGILVVGGCQVYNSSSNDGAGLSAGPTPTPDPNNPEALRFAAAYSVLSSNCLTCHTYTHSFTSYTSEGEFISNGMVVAQSPSTSCLYVKLKGANDPIPQTCPSANLGADMPYGLPELSSQDLDTFVTWINGIGQ